MINGMMMSMNSAYQRKLERNIPKYAWYKVFTKRLYLPLITVQLVSAGNVTVAELAIIAVASSLTQAVLQLPTGYFADRFGNKAALITGAAISAPSPLLYVFMPDFWGGLTASVMFFGGYAFQSGAIEAFMHDTLKSLNRDSEYSKIMGRSQSYGLLANIVLIALVPATYAVHPSLPFLIGFVSLLVMLCLVISFTYPTQEETAAVAQKKSPLAAVRSVVTLQNVALFIFIGILTGVTNKGVEYRELALQDFGIAAAWLGIVLSATSLVGALAGWFIHAVEKLRPSWFFALDVLLVGGTLVVVGLVHDIYVSAASFIVLGGYSRVRLIPYQAQLFAVSHHAYKASLMSALSLFTLIGDIIAITVVSNLINEHGYAKGYYLFGTTVLVTGFILLMFVLATVRWSKDYIK